METCSLTALLPTADEIKTALGTLCALVTVASAFCAATPTPAPGSRWARLYRVIEIAGLVVGKAKDSGVLPPPPLGVGRATAAAIDLVHHLEPPR